MVGVTLLAVPCAYIGWEAKIVQARQNWLQRYVHVHADPCQRFIIEPRILAVGEAEPTLPPLRCWLGDEPHEQIELYKDDTASDIDEAKRLFPEAFVVQFLSE